MRSIHQHIGYYISLSLVMVFGLLLISVTAYDARLQMASVVLTAFSYVLLGILHHVLHHDTTAKIVLEYVLIGSFGITIAYFLLK